MKKYTSIQLTEIINNSIKTIKSETYLPKNKEFYKLNKIFRPKTKYEMELTFKSIQIEFNQSNSNISFSVFLPFSLIPLFYFYDIETFKFILTVVIKFDSSLLNVEVNYDILYALLKKLPESQIELQKLINEKNVTSYKFDWITNLYTYDVVIRYVYMAILRIILIYRSLSKYN